MPAAPAHIGKFELRKVLGKGASGTVYLAFDSFAKMEVALKVLDPEVMASSEFNPDTARQFMNEAALAGKLSHPHIAAIYEAAVHEDSGYIALEYVPGGDLRQYASADKLLPAQDAIEIAFKCCGALDYAFRQGIVHRDLKPANVMVVHGTDIKVADFGAAFFHRAQVTQIAAVGTPLYMSPEQITGQTLGHQSDMFALGVVLYELFTGKRPFLGSSMTEIFQRILHQDPAPPSALRAGLSQKIDHILLRMLRKQPADRYPTWADLALELADAGRFSIYQSAIPDSEKYMALRNIPLLAELNDAEIWELVHAAGWKRLPAQSVVLREGEPGDTLLLLGSGQARVTKQERLLNVLNAGEYFGEMAYVKSGALARQTTVVTMTDALIAEFGATAMRRTSLRCQLQLAHALLNTLIDRLALADERIVRAG